jgi:hypothetical protein
MLYKQYRVAYWLGFESKVSQQSSYAIAVALYESLRRKGLTCALTDSDRVFADC